MTVHDLSGNLQNDSGNQKQIRFINSHYKELFRIPNGGSIRLFYGNGDTMYAICYYLDDCHTEIDGQCLHICDFARRMEKNGIFYSPVL